MIELELPYPPSVNHYWRRVGARTLISRGGRAFRIAVCSILAARGMRRSTAPWKSPSTCTRPIGAVATWITPQKALLDALAHGGAYHDDSQIVHLDTWKREPVDGGKVIVRIVPHGG